MVLTAELIEVNNKKQEELYELIHQLKDNRETQCQLEKHARYEEQLRRNKELMEEAERQLKEMFDKGEKGSLLSPVASEQEKFE